MKTALTLNSPRIRFNHGFHDATHDREMGYPNRANLPASRPRGQLGNMNPLPDGPEFKYYRIGYMAGQNADMSKGRPESSKPAWREHQGEIAEKREERKALREMRPELWARRF